MPKRFPALLPIDSVIKLVKQKLHLTKLSRPSIYFYMKHKKFPRPLAFGVPRQWRRIEVNAWIKRQEKGEK